jgi:hypothetical protein
MIHDVKVSCLILCFCLLLSDARGQIENQRFANKSSAQVVQPCLFDYERGEVSDCIRVGANGSRFIAASYLKELHYGANGLAGVHDAGGWIYVNRRGKVVITGVPTFDNGPDQFHECLVRFERDQKYGFADRKGKVVIPPQYDGAMPFDGGHAKVCLGCVDKCGDPECEHHIFSGGEWLLVDKNGITLESPL